MEKITIKDIAVMANVSYSTVSRAITGSKGVSDDVRDHILSLCKEHGYRVNTLARSMIMKRTNVLGIIIPDVTNPFYSDIVLHLERYSRSKGYITMLCNSLYDDAQSEYLFDFLMGHQVDGIILASTKDSTCKWAEKYNSHIPIAYIGENPGGFTGNFINTDNIRGGILACEYLHSLGHNDILYFGFREHSATHTKRLEGFQKSAQQLGVHLEVFANPRDGSSIENGYILGKELFQNKPSYSAIFAATDTLALGLMQAADECGIRIPEDISVLGFDDIAYANLPKIKLTTIAQPRNLIATNAVDILLEAINHNDSETFTTRALKPYLVERNSCIRRIP